MRETIRLAPNAVVMLIHLCYSAGNGESGAPIPNTTSRVSASTTWPAASSRSVRGPSLPMWYQRVNYPAALMTTDQTMDQLFMTPTTGTMAGSPSGYIGWNPSRFDSQRTPGATNHLDPHPVTATSVP